jgi:hypothetical protein
MNAPAPSPTLWTRLRASFARAFPAAALFIVRLMLDSTDVRRAVLARLRMLECYARKLLFTEAATLPPPPAPRTINAAARHPRKRAERAIDLARPETWSTHFHLFLPRDRCARPTRRASATTKSTHLTAFRVALRIEALRRVLNAPLRHAQRLRRALDAQPKRARRFALRGPRRFVADAVDTRLTLDITSQMLIALTALDTS